MSTHPRRLTRRTVNGGSSTSSGPGKRPKRVVSATDPVDVQKMLIESPKSVLTRVDVNVSFEFILQVLLLTKSQGCIQYSCLGDAF
jgi:hypothetical protein